MPEPKLEQSLARGDVIILDGGMGAQIIGGCCGIGPKHIEVLSANLPSRA